MEAVTRANERITAFVYGTLKHGFPNWRVMPPHAVFLGTARTAVPYPLVVDTEMWIPYMLKLPRHPHAQSIHGELYSITAEDAAFLDRFEGVPTGFYSRENVEVIRTAEPGSRECQTDPNSGDPVKPGTLLLAGCYFRAHAGPPWALKWTVERLQTLPMLERYTADHAAKYVPREERKD